MKRVLVLIILTFGFLTLDAQTNDSNIENGVEVGDVFEIGRLDAPHYKHINFPKKNFIIKRGGVANYSSVEGMKVVVTEIKKKKDDVLQVKIKRANGGRFFGSHSVVTVNLEPALESGELLKL